MKKLLVVLMASMMVLSLALAANAATTVRGSADFIYDFVNKNNAPTADDLGGGTDKYDISLYFENKINDKVQVTMRYGHDQDNAAGPFLREAYAAVKSSFGSWKLGYYDVATAWGGVVCDNTDSAWGRFKAPFTIGYTSPELFDGFTIGATYFRDDNGNQSSDALDVKTYANREAYESGAYIITLAYKGDRFSADYNYIDAQYKRDVNDINDNGYAINAEFKVIDNLKITGYIGKNRKEEDVNVIGFNFKYDAWNIVGDYDLSDDKGAMNRYGYKFIYTLKNGVGFEYRAKDLDGNADGLSAQEFRIKVSFK